MYARARPLRSPIEASATQSAASAIVLAKPLLASVHEKMLIEEGQQRLRTVA